jgi:hypothetical protein
MRHLFLCASLAAALATTAGCNSEPKSRCIDWWRDGTWASETLATDPTQPCRPAEQVCAKEPETQGWTLLAEGYTTDVGRSVRASSLQLDACGQPVVAWAEAYAEYSWAGYNRAVVEVHRWTHDTREPVGPQPVGTFRQADVLVSLALDPIGRPIVAMADGTGRPSVLAYDAPGNYAAVPLQQGLMPDTPGTPIYTPYALSLEVTPDGQPQVAIHRTFYQARLGRPGDSAVYYEVYEHGESGWSTRSELTGADMRTLRVDPAGGSWLVKGQQLMRREDGVWKPHGPILPGGTLADLQFDSDDHPLVLLFMPGATGGGHFELVELADSETWEAHTGPLIGLTRPRLAQAQLRFEPGSGLPIVAWGEHEGQGGSHAIRVLRWNGSEWVPIGQGPEAHSGEGVVYGVSLKLDRKGHPTVAWHSDPGPSLFIARYRP